MKKLYNITLNFIVRYSLWVFLTAVFLLRLPNYYLVFDTTLFTTQVIARILISFIFLIKVVEMISKDKPISTHKNTVWIFLLTVLLFLTQSLSIFSAINTEAFLFRYFKDVLPAILTIFTFYFFRNEYKKVALAIIIPAFLNIGYQALALLNPDLFLSLASNIIYERHYNFIAYDIERSRIHIDTYDEAILPLLIATNSIRITYARFIFIGIIAFFSFVSNWRTRVIMLLFGVISSLFIVKKKSKNGLILISALSLIGFTAVFVSIDKTETSFISRLTLQSEAEDIETIYSRVGQVDDSLKFGFTSLFGVGLGNYYDNLNLPQSTIALEKDISEGAQGYVHNIFGSYVAESGYISLIIFISLLFLFAKDDFWTLKGVNEYKKAFVISYWSIFIYALFNPDVGGAMQVFFWGIRGILLK